MDKRSYFLAACRAEEFRRTAWVMSAFALIREDPEKWRTDNYPYRIVQMPTGMFFVNPENRDELLPIENAKPGEPIFRAGEWVTILKSEFPNLGQDRATVTYGNLLVNFTSIIWPFGPTKMKYMIDEITSPSIEKLILPRFRNTPKEGESREEKYVYVDEYLKFADSMFYLGSLSQLFVPAGSRKAMTVDPKVYELRKKLVAENKDRLHDPAVIAKIDAELVKHDKAWIKGDPAEHFLLSGKAYNIVRKKLFLQMGAEMGLDESQNVDYIQPSLAEGWDISKFPAMNNSLRAGSFNRGAQTMLGGESVKWLLRASSNMSVTAPDCGSKLGNPVALNDENKKRYFGFSIVGEKGPIKITEESAGEYLGKKVMIRSPMYCKMPKTDFCAVCVGDRLAANPNAISAAVAAYGSAFLSLFMASAHAKALLLTKMDYREAII
jgi:hypothetical protein